MPSDSFDAAVIGGGFYGARTALFLAEKGLKVILIEQEDALLSRASRWNQSRIHNGYHYPRSLMTAMASHKNYQKFSTEFKECLLEPFTHIYGIPKKNSKINAAQFEAFAKQINIPLKHITPKDKTIFNKHLIEDVFEAEEAGLDTQKFQKHLQKRVNAEKNITLLLNTKCSKIAPAEKTVHIHIEEEVFQARDVFIACYSGINYLSSQSDLDPSHIKFELTEMALVERPSCFKDKAFTIMDGPFFSIMPFESDGYATLSHVRYTPHVASALGNLDTYDLLQKYISTSMTRFPFMKNDAARYIPALEKLKYVRSIYEVKAVPIKNELDDGRPILVKNHYGDIGTGKPFILSLLGSKLDNIYEWEATLEKYYGK